MEPYFNRPPRDPIRKGVKNWIDFYCVERYKVGKSRFKDKWFTIPGGGDRLKEVLAKPPTGMEVDDWARHVDAYMREDAQHKAYVNTENRVAVPYIGTHGRRSYAEIRHGVMKQTGSYPTLINTFADTHIRDGTYVAQVAQCQHEEMQQLWDAQQNSDNPMTDVQVMEAVLGRRTWYNRGRRGNVSSTQSSDSGLGSQSQPPTGGGARFYTQAEVNQQIADLETRLMGRFETMLDQRLHPDPPPHQNPSPSFDVNRMFPDDSDDEE